jgi:hypothetical protein
MPDSPAPRPIPPRRRWLFRGLAVLSGLSVFGVAEGVCRLLDWGRPEVVGDPFVGFSETVPLFVRDEERGEYRIADGRKRFFVHDAFPLTKGERTRRVFVLGGSTVQGRPYSIETSFATFLELGLAAGDRSGGGSPEHDWEVVNCGGISYASYRLVPILEEVLAYEPDLVVVCTGHNEFLEDRTYGHLREPSAAMRFVGGLRTFNLLRGAIAGSPADALGDRPTFGPEADPILDYNDSLDAYHHDDVWRAGVIAHYEHNVRQLVASARRAGVPIVLVRPPSDLRDTPPFKSEHSPGLSEADRETFWRLVQRARRTFADDPAEAALSLEEAVALDDRHALTRFELAECYESLGRRTEAREAYLAAREQDVCPLRMIAPLEEALRRVAGELEVPLVDAFALLEARCPEGILDGSVLVDHVHPSIESHQLIANALIETLAARGWFHPAPDWRDRAGPAYREHVAGLDDLYFLHGRDTLARVALWAKGRADGPPAAERFPERIGRATNPRND